jgi:hypothetical protein
MAHGIIGEARDGAAVATARVTPLPEKATNRVFKGKAGGKGFGLDFSHKLDRRL